MNIFWCLQCDEGYLAGEPGCPRCAKKDKVGEPVSGPVRGPSDGSAHIVCGALVISAVMFGGAGLLLGFLIWG